MIVVVGTPYSRTVKSRPQHGALKQCYDSVSSRDERESGRENKLSVIKSDDLSDDYKDKKGIFVIRFSCFEKYKQRCRELGVSACGEDAKRSRFLRRLVVRIT